jgi:hypothetical protein
MWKKMLTICDVINEEDVEEPVFQSASTKEDLLAQLMTCKVYVSRKKISRKTRALVMKINEIMELLLNNMYGILAFDSSENNGITRDGFDVFAEYGLEMFVPKPKFLKDKFSNIHIMKRKELSNGKVQYSQQPYGELQSFKIKKDVSTNPLFQGIPSRNVRVGNTDLGNTGYIASKSMWYKLKKIDVILMNVQRMFDIVKTFYANATIDFSLTLNEMYPLPAEFADVYGAEIKDPELVKYIKEQLTVLKDKKYAPTSARLYGLVSGFMDNVAKEVVNQKMIDTFLQGVDDTLNMFNSVQLGGGVSDWMKSVKDTMVNTSITTYMYAKNLTRITLLNMQDSLRAILDMPKFFAIVLLAASVITKCGKLVKNVFVDPLSLISTSTVSCVLTLNLIRMTMIAKANPARFLADIQHRMQLIMWTTDLVCMIIQYGMFKEMHEVLLKQLNKIIEKDNILEREMNEIQVEIQQSFVSLTELSDQQSVGLENIYALHGKLQELMQKKSAEFAQKEGFKYIKTNTPRTKKDLRLILKYMFGNIDDLYEFFPTSMSLLVQRDMAIYLEKNFPIPDMRRFIATCILEKIDKTRYEEKRYIVDYYTAFNTEKHNVVTLLDKNIDSFVAFDAYVHNMQFASDVISNYYWKNIEQKWKQIAKYEMDEPSDTDILYYKYVHCAINGLFQKHELKISSNMDNAYILIVQDLNKILDDIDKKIAFRSFSLTELPKGVCNKEAGNYVNFMRTSRGDSEIDFTSTGGGSKGLKLLSNKTTAKHKKK